MIIVDRIENNIAVAYDDDKKIEIPLDNFAGKVNESDVIAVNADGKYYTDTAKTLQRKAEVIARYKKFKENVK